MNRIAGFWCAALGLALLGGVTASAAAKPTLMVLPIQVPGRGGAGEEANSQWLQALKSTALFGRVISPRDVPRPPAGAQANGKTPPKRDRIPDLTGMKQLPAAAIQRLKATGADYVMASRGQDGQGEARLFRVSTGAPVWSGKAKGENARSIIAALLKQLKTAPALKK